MDNLNIRNIIIFLLVLLIVLIIVNLFTNRHVTNEKPKTETLVNLFQDPASETFFIKDMNERYRVDNCPCGCKGGCNCGPNCTNCSCIRMGDDPGYHFARAYAPDYGTGIDYGFNAEPEFLPCTQQYKNKQKWNQPYEPGANNTRSDLLWNYVNPKMILKSDCLDCKKWTSNTNLNPPGGVINDIASQFSEYYPVNRSNEFPITGYHQFSRKTPRRSGNRARIATLLEETNSTPITKLVPSQPVNQENK